MSEAKSVEATKEPPWARLDRAFRAVIKIRKDDLLREEAKDKRLRKRKRARKPA